MGNQVDRGTPGGSLFRTYEHRRAARELRIRTNHPHIGALVLALSNEPDTTVSFQRGAQAEVRVAQLLQRRCPDAELLFNRRLGARGRDGDIDVLAVTANGVHVVDVKHHPKAEVRVRTSGGLLSPSRQQLLIRGRDHTRLLDSMERQHDVVRRLLAALPEGAGVPLHLALCFVDADLPWFTQSVNGVALLGRKQVARRLGKPGPIGPERRAALLHQLAVHLPPA
jgi:Nuclease-related domain